MAPAEDGPAFIPVPVLDLELTRPEPGTEAGDEAVVLGRVHGIPVGAVTLHRPDPSVGDSTGRPDLRSRTLTALAAELRSHLTADGVEVDDLAAALEAAADVPCRARPTAAVPVSVTVVVCTLGEDPRLRRTVASVLDQTHPHLDVVVVDNQPASGGVVGLLADVHDERLRVVPQPKRGLSAARNAGIAAATGDVVAFTDDDAYADPAWIARLAEPFLHGPEVVCSTGLVVPSELETRAQLFFEEFGAFDKGFERVVWSQRSGRTDPALGRPGEGGALFPYSAGVFGSGNNMAFRRTWLAEHPFDEALGAGTLTRGGEDLDAFLTVMLEDDVLVYEPAAVVKHAARREMAELERQLFGYGSGMAAVVVKHVLRPRRALGVARRLPAGFRKLLDPSSEKNESRTSEFPPHLARTELRGYLAGPVLYARSVWRDRAHDRRARSRGSAAA